MHYLFVQEVLTRPSQICSLHVLVQYCLGCILHALCCCTIEVSIQAKLACMWCLALLTPKCVYCHENSCPTVEIQTQKCLGTVKAQFYFVEMFTTQCQAAANILFISQAYIADWQQPGMLQQMKSKTQPWRSSMDELLGSPADPPPYEEERVSWTVHMVFTAAVDTVIAAAVSEIWHHYCGFALKSMLML